MKTRTATLIGGGAFALVTWFTAGEFASPDNPNSGYEMDSTFIYMLDSARTIAGVPFEINSGYRSSQHNRFVGGVDNSAHTKGLAADIKVRNGRERSAVVRSLLAVGFTRIGVAKGFVHVDIDSTKVDNVIWTY